MVIVFSSDENFVQHLLVALRSLYYHNSEQYLQVYILDGGLSEKSRSILKNSAADLYVDIEFVKIDTSLYKKTKVNGHISLATYYRISIPDLLPTKHDKAIYLDCDIIVNDDIGKLWSFELNNCAIAAVPEYSNVRNLEMGLGNSKTFNAGVLLFNLNKWREEALSSKVRQFLEENQEKIKFWDQDALNAVLLNDWVELPLKWNVTSPYFANRWRIGGKEVIKQIDNPSIIHFSATFKPWHYQLRHPFKSLYYKYLQNTCFKNYKPPDRNILNVLKKSISLILIYLHLRN